MLKRLYQLLRPTDSAAPTIIPESEHHISKHDVSSAARKVISNLKQAGYSAYLVGGGVRDFLLDFHPKDFDVATNATPEQTKAVFKNARLIGRRFRIVHVRFGREVIEVTTFRDSPQQDQPKKDHNQSDKGILLRDNVYGDIRSDALRRDFTVNALYYDPEDGTIHDYTGGLKDLNERQLRIIGDPDARYKEDPVRMLRAVRFAAKLGFSLTSETEAPIREHANYLADIPPARLFEEVLKLFISGYATAILTQLREFGLLAYLFPGTESYLQEDDPYYQKLIFATVANTDKRLRNNKRVTPAFIYAAMLWPSLHARMHELINSHKVPPYEAMQQAAQGVISQQLSYTAIPKRFLIPMREIWNLQLRFDKRDSRRAHQTLEHPRFRAAYDFLLLREEAGEQLDGLGMWWTSFQDANAEEKGKLLKDVPSSGKGRQRRRRKKPRKNNNSGDNGDNKQS
ncbi:polynucleotide adenylyltransferase PcnB [Agarilytica rhodophyticola]|uniref:polynucleotide adenylyltransferase PcnB n=1 Tax=Agarilytica rhodophyticola TaxID=1737490 RepID=UPI000B342CA2|nr:polynucleotide adenylyltransferase PcnB [Agarilytica rhodophyticola]